MLACGRSLSPCRANTYVTIISWRICGVISFHLVHSVFAIVLAELCFAWPFVICGGTLFVICVVALSATVCVIWWHAIFSIRVHLTALATLYSTCWTACLPFLMWVVTSTTAALGGFPWLLFVSTLGALDWQPANLGGHLFFLFPRPDSLKFLMPFRDLGGHWEWPWGLAVPCVVAWLTCIPTRSGLWSRDRHQWSHKSQQVGVI